MSTAVLAFVSDKFDMIWPYSLTVPLLKDLQSQMPQAICEMTPIGVNVHLLINRDKPPFDNLDLRRAMALSLDRKAFTVHSRCHRRYHLRNNTGLGSTRPNRPAPA